MKKKTSVYIFFPVLLLVLFSAYYWNFSSSYDQKVAAKAAEVKRVHDEKVAEDNRLRLKAINDALVVQEHRKEERKAKAERIKKEKEDMANAVVARDHARSEANRFREKYDRLVKDVQTEKDEIERITHDKGELQTQLDFLKILTAKAEGNVQSLATVLNQVAASDAAYAAAAKAAAAAAAKAKQ
jgi:hypothetical protein